MNRLTRDIVLMAFLAILGSAASMLAECAPTNRVFEQPSVNRIQIQFSGNHTTQARSQVLAAMSAWNNSNCNGPGAFGAANDFPMFTQAAVNGPFIRFKHFDGVGQNCASLSGLEIQYWDSARAPDGQIFNCNAEPGMMVQTFAHELGHRLGLGEAACAGCESRVMAGRNYVGGTYIHRSVQPDDCATVGNVHVTGEEAQAEEDYCNTPGSPCHDGDYTYCSPIVIHLDAETRASFTSPRNGVYFDLTGQGRDLVSWTQGNSNSALLVWDRNGNGQIDNGSELFGSSTPLLGGGLANMGYTALTELDALQHGGNGNGWLDSGDAHWVSLQLWIDRSHDGVSQRSELISLEEGGVYGIKAWEAAWSRAKDVHGNWLKWSAPAYLLRNGKRFETPSVDVFFVHARKPSTGQE